MKNSLFKRALAAVSTVPLALTQCLCVANAVNVEDDAAPAVMAAEITNTAVTLDDGSDSALLYIAPSKPEAAEKDGYIRKGNTFEKYSSWDATVSALLAKVAASSKKNGTLDLSAQYNKVLSKLSGQKKEIAEAVISKIGEVSYSVDGTTVTVSASVADVVPALESIVKNKVGSSLDEIADEYDVPELKNVKFFEGITASGKATVEVSLDGTVIEGSVTFTDETGKEYKGIEAKTYVNAKIAALQASAEKKIDELCTEYDLDDAELEAKVEETQEYKDLIQNLKEGYTPEEGEIETMILESVEFKNMVTDYMADHSGMTYEEAEAKMMDSDKYKNLVERFTNGINLSDEEILEILEESDEYNSMIEDYMAENEVTLEEATAAVKDSDDYKALVEKFTDDYTYTDEEIEAMVKGSEDYKARFAEAKAEYEEKYAEMKGKADSAKKTVQKYVAKANSAMDKAEQKYDNGMKRSLDKSWANLAEAIDWANTQLDKPTPSRWIEKLAKYAPSYADKKIPNSAAAIASKQFVQNTYNSALNRVNNITGDTFSVNIALAEIADLADSVYDINVNVAGGNAAVSCKFEDKEADEAKAYIEANYPVKVVEIYKEAEVEADYSSAKNGEGSADVKIKRVVVVEDVVTTTTTTTTTETSTTTTTASETTGTGTTATNASDNGSGTATTATNASDNGSGTVTTATDDNGGSGTVTTATDDNGGSGTVTTATDDNGGSGTVTTATVTDDNGGSGTTTTASDNGQTSGETTTVTVVKQEMVVHFDVTAAPGYYLNTDKEFNLDQIERLRYSLDLTDVSYDLDGNVVAENIIESGRLRTVRAGNYEVKDTPGSVYTEMLESNNLQFAHQIPLYATTDITTNDGVVVLEAGKPIKMKSGQAVSITCYVGVKGDCNFDLKADAKDASLILIWYSKISTGASVDDTHISNSIFVEADPGLDAFALYLADVNNEKIENNFKLTKAERNVDAKDASAVLIYYSMVSTGKAPNRDTWKEVLGEYAKED